MVLQKFHVGATSYLYIMKNLGMMLECSTRINRGKMTVPLTLQFTKGTPDCFIRLFISLGPETEIPSGKAGVVSKNGRSFKWHTKKRLMFLGLFR